MDTVGMNSLEIGYDRGMRNDCQVTAVVLAGGKGTRMLPLTRDCPKPLQRVLGRSLLEWKLDMIPEQVDDIVIVVGHQGHLIEEAIGKDYAGRQVRYVTQDQQLGTMHALSATLPLHLERMLVMMGDDLYTKADMERMLTYDTAMLVCERDIVTRGAVDIARDGRVVGILEEVAPRTRGWVNTGMYVLPSSVCHLPPVFVSPTEMGLPQTILAPESPFRVDACETHTWMQVTTPEDLVHAGAWLLEHTGHPPQGRVYETTF